MKLLSVEVLFVFLAFMSLMAAPAIHASASKDIKLVKKKFSCHFICLKFSRTGSHGNLYEGHEKFKLFISGSKYEDDFEKRVFSKANLSCSGSDKAKLVDFNSQNFIISDEMGRRKTLTKVTTVKVFSPASHCVAEDANSKPTK